MPLMKRGVHRCLDPMGEDRMLLRGEEMGIEIKGVIVMMVMGIEEIEIDIKIDYICFFFESVMDILYRLSNTSIVKDWHYYFLCFVRISTSNAITIDELNHSSLCFL